MDDELLPIGRFARLVGLSVGALRHYDDLGILRPADTDRFTGYRRYRTSQLEDGRVVARLRELEVPLEEIRDILAADDPVERARRLDDHRARLVARNDRLVRVLHQVRGVTDRGEPIVSKPPEPPELDPATRRALAAGLYNHTWTLLETHPRTPAQDDELIHSAHASRYHWGELGADIHLARGEWLCSRVYATLGRAEPALHHARRCIELVEAAGADASRESWDLPAAYEAMARASAVAGDTAETARWKAKATEALAGITDAEDRTLIEGDLATLP